MPTPQEKLAVRNWLRKTVREDDGPTITEPWDFFAGYAGSTPVAIPSAKPGDPVEYNGQNCILARINEVQRRFRRGGPLRRDWKLFLIAPAEGDEPTILEPFASENRALYEALVAANPK